MADQSRNNGSSSGRDRNGRFATGNPGKPPGSRHKATLAAQALLQGEAEQLTRVAIERALEGDAGALRLCLERLVPPPKDSPVRFAMPPMTTARDAGAAAGAIVEALAAGELTPIEATHAMGLVDSFRRVLETTDLERRTAGARQLAGWRKIHAAVLARAGNGDLDPTLADALAAMVEHLERGANPLARG